MFGSTNWYSADTTAFFKVVWDAAQASARKEDAINQFNLERK